MSGLDDRRMLSPRSQGGVGLESPCVWEQQVVNPAETLSACWAAFCSAGRLRRSCPPDIGTKGPTQSQQSLGARVHLGGRGLTDLLP